MKKTPLFTRSIAAILFTLLSFTGPGLLGCSPASDSTDVQISQDEALAGLGSFFANLQNGTFGEAMVLEFLYTGATIRRTSNDTPRLAFQRTVERLSAQAEALSGQDNRLQKTIETLVLNFNTPQWPEADACTRDFLSYSPNGDFHTACGEIIRSTVVGELTGRAEELFAEPITKLAQNLSKSVFNTDKAAIATTIVAPWIKNRIANILPELELASLDAGTTSNKNKATQFFAKAFHELLGPSTAKAQAIAIPLVILALIAIVFLIYWYGPNGPGNLAARNLASNFQIGRAATVTQRDINRAIDTNLTLTETGVKASFAPMNINAQGEISQTDIADLEVSLGNFRLITSETESTILEMVGSDGQISPDEREAIEELIGNLGDVAPEVLARILKEILEALQRLLEMAMATQDTEQLSRIAESLALLRKAIAQIIVHVLSVISPDAAAMEAFCTIVQEMIATLQAMFALWRSTMPSWLEDYGVAYFRLKQALDRGEPIADFQEILQGLLADHPEIETGIYEELFVVDHEGVTSVENWITNLGYYCADVGVSFGE
ncbi:MAG: hypothetical protein IPJ88_11275 [Myxococcales bacterium]|nr:MAG: hypothetical protein IPJ88_11275 [Myxococcales bacterium]